MELIVISLTALLASLMTFFSGFGLGTILTPVFVLFFPVDVAIALTGIVHLLNNIFKISLVGKQINWPIGLRFGLTSIIGAFIGAWFLLIVADSSPLHTYSINNKLFFITPVKLIVAVLMIAFSLVEIIPFFAKIQVDKNKLYIGGVISGFFGGLSGNQGALRSMFLIRAGLSKEAFIATGILIACFVDVTRLTLYFNRMSGIDVRSNLTVLITAVLSAFAGAFIGSKLLKKVTLSFVQITVTVMIVVLAIALGTGLL